MEIQFENGIYTVYANRIKELKIGDIIHITNTNTECWDCMRGCFMNGIKGSAQVKVEILNVDHSDEVCAAARVIEFVSDDDPGLTKETVQTCLEI